MEILVPGGGGATQTVTKSGLYIPSDHGLKAWTLDPGTIIGNSQLVAGDVLGVRIPITQAFTAANVNYIVAGAAAVGLSGVQGLALYDQNGTQIGTVPDQTTNFSSTGQRTAALTVVGGQSLALVPGTYVYVLFLSAASTTPPSLARHTGNPDGANFGLVKATARAIRQATAQTILPTAPGAPSGWNSITNANVQLFWAGLS